MPQNKIQNLYVYLILRKKNYKIICVSTKSKREFKKLP